MKLTPISEEEFNRDRQQLQKVYGKLYFATEALLFRHDPIGINYGNNMDEYSPEASTILPRLQSCFSVEDVQRVLHEEFSRWFSDDIAGPYELYAPIATDLWTLWQEFSAE